MDMTDQNTKDGKDSLASLCGQPAELDDAVHLFSNHFINKIDNEDSIRTHTLPIIPAQNLLLNSNDEDLMKTCDQSTSECDTFVNVAEEMGKSIDGVVIRCKSSSLQHPNCNHPMATEEDVPKQSKRTLFRCTVCHQINDSMNELIQHQRTKHHKISEEQCKTTVEGTKIKDISIRQTNCDLCSCSHILGFFSCHNCTFTSTCPFVLENHMGDSHRSQQIYNCPFCDHENRFFTAIEKHVLEQHMGPDRKIRLKPKPARITRGASQQYDSDSGPTNEMRVTSLIDGSKGDVNSEPLPRISLRTSTFKFTYTPEETIRTPYLCPFCAACFLRPDRLTKHMDRNHEPGSHHHLRCCVCFKSANNFFSLNAHYKTLHTEEYDVFIKATCASLDRSDYKTIASVLDLRSYRHIVAGKVDITSYSSSDMWYRYHKNTNDAVLLSCGLCLDGPMIKPDLLRHLEIHTRHWPYQCVSCHQCFKGTGEATEHTDACCQKRPRLDEIEYTNQQAEILLLYHSHGMIEEGSETIADTTSLRQFNTYQVLACNICLYTTVTLAELITHLAEHNNVQLHYCSDCDLIYRKRVNCMKCLLIVSPLPKKEAPWLSNRTTLELMSRVATLMDLQVHTPRGPKPGKEPARPRSVATPTTTKTKEARASVASLAGTSKAKEVSNRPGKQAGADLTLLCPHCDFESSFGELYNHYEAMHADVAVCLECEDVPSFRIADYNRHMAEQHPLVPVLDYAKRRKDSRLRAKELVELLGQIAIKKYGMKASTSYMKCKLIDMKLSTAADGVASARFVCRQCLHSTRNKDTFFTHIATHLQVAEFQCLLCQHSANADEIKHHYVQMHRVHEVKLPDLLPTSLQYKRYRELVRTMLLKLDEENVAVGSASATSQVQEPSPLKEEPASLDEKMDTASVVEIDNESDSWKYAVFCPYCQLPTTDSNECRLHVELSHPRKQMAIGLELRIPVSEETGDSVSNKNSKTVDRKSRKRFSQTYEMEAVDADTVEEELIAIPAGYQVQIIEPSELVHRYSTKMMELYNHFSIFEVVAVTGSHLQCHLCELAQTTFPALFEHWNREHLEIMPYLCAYCGRKAKRPMTIVSHEKRAHPKNAVDKKYVVNDDLFELMFDEMDSFVKTWLRHYRVDSFVPDDMNLVMDCHVKLEDIRHKKEYKSYFKKTETVSDSDDDDVEMGSSSMKGHGTVGPAKCSRVRSRPGWMSSGGH